MVKLNHGKENLLEFNFRKEIEFVKERWVMELLEI